MTTARFRLSAACTTILLAACSNSGAPSAEIAGTTSAQRASIAPRAASPARSIYPHLDARRAARRGRHASPKKIATGEAMQAVSLGGPPMTSPKIVPILFPGDPYDADVRVFFAHLAGSDYWAKATGEYGVGPATVLPPFVPTFAPTEDTAGWLTAALANPPPGLPAPDDHTLYAIVYPPGWSAELGACTQYGADHYWAQMPSGQNVVYTENPICPNGYIGLTGQQDATDALSHEIVEAVTDFLGNGYIDVNWALSGWASAFEGGAGAELGDLCEFQPDAAYLDPQIGSWVQRSWSNASAAAGHDPCLPLLPSRPVYFNTDLVLAQGTQQYPFGYAKGLTLEPGQEATIPVRLFADGAMGAWQLAAEEEPNPHLSPDTYGELSFSWDEPRGRAGDTRHLTVRRSPPPDGGTNHVFLRVAIKSTSGSTVNKSWLVVGLD